MKRAIAQIETSVSIRKVEDLIKPRFDVPVNLFHLFSGSRQTELLRLISGVKENAGKHMA